MKGEGGATFWALRDVCVFGICPQKTVAPLSGVGTVSVSRHCQMFPVVRVGGGGENCPGWRTTIETTTAQLVNLPTMQETQRCRFDHWVRKIPWRRAWQSTPVFLPGEFYGQRSLVGYSPWSGKDLDMTKVIDHAHIETAQTKPLLRTVLLEFLSNEGMVRNV